MTPDQRLTEVFDRGLHDGVGTLSPTDHELYRIQDFIIEFEIGGLSGYFYNRLADLSRIMAAIEAMRCCGLPAMAALLGEAAGLFAGYVDPDPPATGTRFCGSKTLRASSRSWTTVSGRSTTTDWTGHPSLSRRWA